jgi:hypothetical protein
MSADAKPVASRLGVPAYFGPWETLHWARLLADRPSLVVINPATGPGTKPISGYSRLVKQLRRQGCTVLSYVHTGYLDRSTSEVAADCAKSLAFYGVDGIFFDEIPVDNTNRVRRSLDVLIEMSPQRCALNTGRRVSPSWFERWPQASFVTFEGTAVQLADRLHRELTGKLAVEKFAMEKFADRQWWLVHSVARRSCATLRLEISELGIGYGYVTPDRLPNPWDIYAHS